MSCEAERLRWFRFGLAQKQDVRIGVQERVAKHAGLSYDMQDREVGAILDVRALRLEPLQNARLVLAKRHCARVARRA